MSRPRRLAPHRALPLAVLLALLVAACGGDDGGDADAPSQEPRSTVDDATPDDESGGDDADAERDAELDLPRSTTFAGAELALTGATWSDDRDGERLLLELTTGFVDGFPGTDSFLPVQHFVIETPDGERVGATGVDFLAEVPVAPTADTTSVLAFELAEDALEGSVLVYDDGQRVPALLPLTGEVPEPDYPIRVDVDETEAPQLATGCEPSPADVTLVAVEWDVDAGVDQDGEKLAEGVSSRAAVDHRWLRAEVEVTARVGQCGGTFANSETFRVLADDVAVDPVNSESFTLADGETQAMTYLFEVPVEVRELALEAGKLDAQTATFDLDVPELPDPGEVG